MSQSDQGKPADCGRTAGTPHEDSETVITPGGPIPKDMVHPVGPDEMVIRNPDGTYSIVPKPKRNDSGT